MNKHNTTLSAQSKGWILQALLTLMDKKDFRAITVKEIAQRAGVDRKTFYRNFNSKEEVLRFYLDDVCKDYIRELNQYDELTTFIIAKTYFTLCKKHISFVQKLEKNNLMVFLLMAFDEYLPIIHQTYEVPDEYLPYSDYALSYHAGGFWNISAKWIRNGADKTPEEMAGIIEYLLASPL